MEYEMSPEQYKILEEISAKVGCSIQELLETKDAGQLIEEYKNGDFKVLND